MRFLRISVFTAAIISFPLLVLAQSAALEICGWPVKTRTLEVASVKIPATSRVTCQRPASGSVIMEPEDFRSQNGMLRLGLTVRSSVDADGHVRYCYLAKDGSDAPNIRVKPGDWLILSLKNEIEIPPATAAPPMKMGAPGKPTPNGCTKTDMTPLSTNLHFHGLTVPPVCHQDDVLKTVVQAGDAPFEYRFQIPPEEAPGLYWYHPHVHGLTSAQVLGGASGALIVEGIERANRQLAGLPERVFIIRDQDLLNPNAKPVKTNSMPSPLVLRDAEGDILNTGTGTGKPAKDLSINFVPVSYPNYLPAVIKTKPSERQVWRVLNASAITYLDLQVLVGSVPQLVGVVSLDGIPLNENGMDADRIIWESHIALPPAGRVEFIFKGLPGGEQGSLVTRSVDTGPAGENDPTRPLAKIVAAADSPEPRSRLAASPAPLPPPSSAWLGNVAPARTRKLYFSEEQQDPSNPNSPTKFFITVEGQTPAVFDPNATMPNITVHQGDVEDWVIENRSRELHAFHIHQIHFMLIGWNGVPIDEPFLRDTVNVPYWDGRSPQYPSVKLRMDFRDPNAVGTFVYHCHLLEHEDGGMMGLIRVEPAPAKH
jgi:FtsP/CotA-like multicopper oxidase with cupredoxin domain